MSSSKRGYQKKGSVDRRLFFVRAFFIAFTAAIIVKLGMLQVVNAGLYQSLAEGQHSFYEELFAERGEIFIRDWKDQSLYAAATTELRAFVYSDPRKIEDPKEAARMISEILGYRTKPPAGMEPEVAEEEPEVQPTFSDIEDLLLMDEPEEVIEEAAPELPVEEPVEELPIEQTEEMLSYQAYLQLVERFSKENDPYEPVARSVSEKTLQRILDLELEGIYYLYENARAYPENSIGGQLFGFLGQTSDGESVGYYGIEGYFDDYLGGTNGFIDSEADSRGRWIGVGGRQFQPAVDGGDLVLTIDRTIQYKVCEMLKVGVERYKAASGSVVVLQPGTGKVIAMCGFPDFDPNNYADVEDGSVYQNRAIAGAYEPGSVFKPIVAAAAIDAGVIGPNTTFNDTGEVVIGPDRIRNSDLKANGIQSMTQVLENSLNTGMVFIMRQLGRDRFKEYIEAFGFGKQTGIELQTESAGSLASLEEKSEIYAATASFGQGILTTPLQVTAAYNAMASGGKYYEPYIVEEMHGIDGRVEIIEPREPRQVITAKTAATITAMMVSVVENGHAGLAGNRAHYIAGKTGTAQVARTNGRGYDPNRTIATFVGYGPVEDPKFTMLVLLDTPTTSPWASSTSAPLFGEISSFLLNYFQAAPTRAESL